MLQILDLSRNLFSLQMGFAELSPLHEVVSLSIEDADLAMYFSQLVIDSMMAFDLCQDGPVIQSCDLLPEHVVLHRQAHKQGPKPAK